MAKVPFSKLEVKICDDSCSTFYCNLKGEKIYYEVKRYLPVEEKLEMITKIINQSVDDNGFYNPMKVQIFTVLEVTYAYTNLSFTAKQKENVFKLYDQLVSTGIFIDIKNCIQGTEWQEVENTIIKTIDNVYKYKNSALGVIEAISTDYSAVNMDLEAIQQKLEDPNALGLIKEIIPLMNA